MNTALLLKSEVKERHAWTDAAIKKFLGSPDESKRNWLYPNGPRLALYARQRVLEAEAIPEWQEWLQGYEKRRERVLARQKAVDADAIQWAETVEITLRFTPIDVLEEAIENYNYDFWGTPRSQVSDFATTDSDRDFLERITGNYLRHVCTDYDVVLTQMPRCSCREELHEIIQSRAMSLVAPYLREEVTK